MDAQRVRRVLLKARAVVLAGWTQGAFAHDDLGLRVSAFNKGAVCFCTVGAVRRVTRGRVYLRTTVLNLLQKYVPRPLVDWNDDELRTQDEVLALFDRALADAD